MKIVLKTALFIFLLGLIPPVHGEPMDLATHDLLIQKLEMGQGKSVSRSLDIETRLADLYSERARLKEIAEAEKNCRNCLKAKGDRQVALKKYLYLFEKLGTIEKERVFVQIVQNYYVLKRFKESDALYHRVYSGKSYSKSIKARAALALGENAFFKGQYEKAERYFKESLKWNSLLQPIRTRHRLIWCRFNRGEYKSARRDLILLLSQGEWRTQQPVLHSEISKDLIPFFTKSSIGHGEIQQIEKLSPKADAKANLLALSDELGRLSRPGEMNRVNYYLLKNFSTPGLQKNEIGLEIAQSEYLLGRKTKAAQSYFKAMAGIHGSQCEDKKFCEQLKEKSRRFVVNWHHDEKIKPTRRLIDQYGVYLRSYPDDFDLAYWAAQDAEKSKFWKSSQNFYTQVAQTLFKIRKSAPNFKNSIFKNSLLGAIRVSEASNAIVAQRKAYNLYLELNPKGSKSFEVRYQLAFGDYQQKRNKVARLALKKLVDEYQSFGKKNHYSFAKKAADLYLDILAQEKNTDGILNGTKSFSKVFPKDRKEFEKIYRNTLIKKSNLALKMKPKATGELSESLSLMKKLSFRGLDDSEKIALLYTHNLLAERLQNLGEVRRTAYKMLSFKRIDKKNKSFAVDQLIAAAQATLNYKEAFTLTKKYKMVPPASKDVLLRLGMLAELAGKDPSPYYKKFLNKKTGVLEGNRVRARMVRRSRRPWTTLKPMLPHLKRSPLTLSELALETFLRFKNKTMAKKVLSLSSVAKKPAGKILARHLQYDQFLSQSKQLRKHRIGRLSEKKMKSGISQRIQFIEDLEGTANGSMRSGNWPVQVAALKVLRDEYMRFNKDLVQLPVPRSIPKSKIADYQTQVARRASEFGIKSINVKKQLEKIWVQQKFVAELQKNSNGESRSTQLLVAREARFLLPYSPEAFQNSLAEMAREPKNKWGDLRAIQRHVRKNPFDKRELVKLKELEAYHDRDVHVAFIDQRLLQLDREVQ